MRHRIMTIGFALLVALAEPFFAASAQAPTPFDGKYAGTATQSAGARKGSNCITISGMDMTVAAGRVVIHEIAVDGGRTTYAGEVDAAGEVSASHSLSTITGSIRNNTFTGHRARRRCYFNVEMTKG
jgi:hypothetical protein